MLMRASNTWTRGGKEPAAELTDTATAPEEVVSVAFEFFSSRTGFVPVGLEELLPAEFD